MRAFWRGSGWILLSRLGVMLFALSTLLFVPEFIDHTRGHFTGSIHDTMIVGRWHVVAVNILVFLAFLFPLTFRRRADWKELSLVTAFFVSLFVEMYGAPFLVYLASRYLAPADAAPPETAVTVEVMGVEFAYTVPMVYGTLLMAFGTVLVAVGWVQLYRGVQRQQLVTTGVYAVSRNPQYLGFMLVIAGWWVGWPTVLVTVLAPVLLFMYYRLCRLEEREMEDLPGYDEYRRRVPLLI